jgi:RHS repeat-associated protein
MRSNTRAEKTMERDFYFYRARYYNPKFQRFTGDDPIGFGGGDVNLYAYVGNQPINFEIPVV